MAAADAVASAQLGMLLENKEHELQQIEEIERLVDELVAAEGSLAHDETMVLVDCMYGLIDELAAEEVAHAYAAFQMGAMCVPCSQVPRPSITHGLGAAAPAARLQDRVDCPNCQRVVSSARFAPHLDKCLQNARPLSAAADASAVAASAAAGGALARHPSQPHAHSGAGGGGGASAVGPLGHGHHGHHHGHHAGRPSEDSHGHGHHHHRRTGRARP